MQLLINSRPAQAQVKKMSTYIGIQLTINAHMHILMARQFSENIRYSYFGQEFPLAKL